MAKKTKIRQSAKGEACQIRIPMICNGNPETVVLCHLNGAGWSLKASDIHGAYGCSSCHDAVDGRSKTEHDYTTLKAFHLDGIIRTQIILMKKGLLCIK